MLIIIMIISIIIIIIIIIIMIIQCQYLPGPPYGWPPADNRGEVGSIIVSSEKDEPADVIAEFCAKYMLGQTQMDELIAPRLCRTQVYSDTSCKAVIRLCRRNWRRK